MTLEQTQNIIADDSFQYLGNSLEIIEIVNAIKDGYRLYKPSEIITEMENELRRDKNGY